MFRQKLNQPDYSSLHSALVNSGVQTKNNALYQTIKQLIDRIMKMQGLFVQDIEDLNNSINETQVEITQIDVAGYPPQLGHTSL